MKQTKRIISALFLLAGLSANAQHTVASGGDYIRQVFEQARTAASYKIEKINRCSFDGLNIKPEIQDWILANKVNLKKDVELSRHIWVAEDQPTCAYTFHSATSDVYLSFSTCNKTTTNVAPALFTLVHESAHHLLVHEEDVADQIANAVMMANEVLDCKDTPSDEQAAFDAKFQPEICQGPKLTDQDVKSYFKPGQPTALAGSYQFYARSRFCYNISGCGDWVKNAVWHQDEVYEALNYNLSLNKYRMTFSASVWKPSFYVNFINLYESSDDFVNMTDQPNQNLVRLYYGKLNTIYLEKNLSGGSRLKRAPLQYNKYTGGAQTLDFPGSLTKTCGWYKLTGRVPIQHLSDTATTTDGYQENEVVFYGTH